MDFYCKALNRSFELQLQRQRIDELFRNYATVIPPQDLLSDLLEEKEDKDNVQSFVDATSGIDKNESQTTRPFIYAKAYPEILKEDLLRPFIAGAMGKFGIGRYGDGFEYGVFYCALDVETSMKESIYHAFNEFKSLASKMKESEFIKDRKMIRVGFDGDLVDLSSIAELTNELTKDSSETCQELGKFASKNSIHALKVPSARSNGHCFPIFEPKSIITFDHRTAFLFNFKIIISKKNPAKIKVEELKTHSFDISEIPGLDSK